MSAYGCTVLALAVSSSRPQRARALATHEAVMSDRRCQREAYFSDNYCTCYSATHLFLQLLQESHGDDLGLSDWNTRARRGEPVAQSRLTVTRHVTRTSNVLRGRASAAREDVAERSKR